MKYLLLSEDLLATYEMENERKNEKEEKGERKRVFVRVSDTLRTALQHT
jgi:hypothetical protein